MRKALLTIAIVFAIAFAGSAQAQLGNIQLYFDDHYTQGSAMCPADPPGTVFDTLYVVANNLDMWYSAAEFMIAYTPQMAWMGDQTLDALSIGSTPAGIALAWTLPQNGFGTSLLMRVWFVWMCDDCSGITNTPLDVVAHPTSGKVQFVRWPDNSKVDVVGMRSLICPTTPVEDATWGQIKALYN